MANLESNYENGNNIFPKYFVNCKKNLVVINIFFVARHLDHSKGSGYLLLAL